MKGLWLTLCSVALFSSLNFSYAADGTIKFSGRILNSACMVDSTSETSVFIGNIPKSKFTNVGSRSAYQDFKIVLKNCPVGSQGARAINILFTGKPDNTIGNGTLLQLDSNGSDTASGVGILLARDDNTPININSWYTPTNYQAEMTIPLKVAYQSTNTDVRPGQANGTIEFSIHYK